MNELGNLLKQLRERAKMSLKDVYKATGISDSRLNRIERGANASEPGVNDIKTLARLYGVSLIELYLSTGYLNDEDVSSYIRVFNNVNLLTEDEKISIQTQIDLFTKGRG